LYSWPNIIIIIRKRKMRSAGHVAYASERMNYNGAVDGDPRLKEITRKIEK
jgi:hypothetical protein